MIEKHTENVDFRYNDDVIKTIKSWLKSKAHAKIGILDNDRGAHAKGVAEIGAIHEFGASARVTPAMQGWFWYNLGINISKTHIDIPERSFLRLTMNQKVSDFNSFLNSQGQGVVFMQVVTGKWTAVLDAMALRWLEYVQEAFYTSGWGAWPPLSDVTIVLRDNNSDVPLFNTGALYNSLAREVVNA